MKITLTPWFSLLHLLVTFSAGFIYGADIVINVPIENDYRYTAKQCRFINEMAQFFIEYHIHEAVTHTNCKLNDIQNNLKHKKDAIHSLKPKNSDKLFIKSNEQASNEIQELLRECTGESFIKRYLTVDAINSYASEEIVRNWDEQYQNAFTGCQMSQGDLKYGVLIGDGT